jgi:phage/plasmid primase-like uncharacterized protein
VDVGNRSHSRYQGISPLELARAKAVPIADIVGGDLPLVRKGHEVSAKCPFHKERTPSFYLFNGDHFHCFGCGAHGDTIAYIMRTRRLDFTEAVKLLAGRGLEPPPRAAHISTPSSGRSEERRLASPASIQYIKELWDSADAPKVAELYLASRGIRLRPKPLPPALRGHKSVKCTEIGKPRPAVLAAIQAPSGEITALQRIWVETILVSDCGKTPEKGTRATDLEAPKKTIGQIGTGAVRLAEARSLLGIAEGVESAMAAAQIYRMPVWAALGAQRMGQIELPECVKQILIFGDNGVAGEAAAAKAVTAYRRRGYQCQSVFPEPPHSDFCDQLCAR